MSAPAGVMDSQPSYMAMRSSGSSASATSSSTAASGHSSLLRRAAAVPLEDYTQMDDAHLPLKIEPVVDEVSKLHLKSGGARRSKSRGTRPDPLPNAVVTDLCLPGKVHRAGWLTKRGDVVKNWKLRWVVVSNGSVYYFVTPSAKQSRGCFSLESYRITPYSDPQRPYSFQLESAKKKRVWIFAANTETELKEWTSFFQEEIDAYDDAAEDEDKARAADAHHASSDEDDDYDEPYDDSFVVSDDKKPPKLNPSGPPRVYPRVVSSGLHELHQENLRRSMHDRSTDSAATIAAHTPVSAAPHASLSPPPSACPSAEEKIDPSVSLEYAPWYILGCDRVQADAMLTKELSFLVRQRDASSPMVLSVMIDGRVRHYKVFYFAIRGYSLGGEDAEFYSSLAELLRYYQDHNLPNSATPLGRAYGLG